jgi:hypothetical protein
MPLKTDREPRPMTTSLSTSTEDRLAQIDREARPYVVGEVANPGVIERFVTATEASRFIEDNFLSADIDAGCYYIDGPEV